MVENTKFPIIINKKNSMMIGAALAEILVGIIFGFTSGGVKSILLWIFVVMGVITALSVLAEYKQDIVIKENKIEFYKNNDLIKSIKYSNIDSISIEKGNEPKNKKKDFFAISFSNNDKKANKSRDNDPKLESYLINPMNYSSQDFKTIKNIIVMKNSAVKIDGSVDKFIR